MKKIHKRIVEVAFLVVAAAMIVGLPFMFGQSDVEHLVRPVEEVTVAPQLKIRKVSQYEINQLVEANISEIVRAPELWRGELLILSDDVELNRKAQAELAERTATLPLPLPETISIDNGGSEYVLDDQQRYILMECIVYYWAHGAYSAPHVSGWLANIYRESGFNPNARAGGNFGLLQFCGGRLMSLKAEFPLSWGETEAQLEYSLFSPYEEKQWYGKYDEFLDAETPDVAAKIICTYYLRPRHAKAEANRRGDLAMQFYTQLYV
jgi:hypothetical protein